MFSFDISIPNLDYLLVIIIGGNIDYIIAFHLFFKMKIAQQIKDLIIWSWNSNKLYFFVYQIKFEKNA
jgi:hypothetical protein